MLPGKKRFIIGLTDYTYINRFHLYPLCLGAFVADSFHFFPGFSIVSIFGIGFM